jgi:hypothetical protein
MVTPFAAGQPRGGNRMSRRLRTVTNPSRHPYLRQAGTRDFRPHPTEFLEVLEATPQQRLHQPPIPGAPVVGRGAHSCRYNRTFRGPCLDGHGKGPATSFGPETLGHDVGVAMRLPLTQSRARLRIPVVARVKDESRYSGMAALVRRARQTRVSGGAWGSRRTLRLLASAARAAHYRAVTAVERTEYALVPIALIAATWNR